VFKSKLLMWHKSCINQTSAPLSAGSDVKTVDPQTGKIQQLL